MSTDLSLHRRFSAPEAAWHLVTPPVEEPVAVSEARRYLSLTQTNDDIVIEAMVRAAREEGEDFMSRAFVTQTWQLALRLFFDQMSLPRAFPLQNDSGATPSTAPIVQYYDADDVLQTLSTSVYVVDTSARPGQIVRASGQSWPTLSPDRQGARVLITYVCGYTDVALVPERIKQGIRMRLAAPYSDREGLDPGHSRAREAAEACWSDVVYWIPPAPRGLTNGIGWHDRW